MFNRVTQVFQMNPINQLAGLPFSISELIGIVLVLWGVSAFFRAGYYRENVGYEDIGQVILTFGWVLYVLENTATLSEAVFWEAVAVYTLLYLLATVIGVKLTVFLGEFAYTIQNGGLKKKPADEPAYNHLDSIFPNKSSKRRLRLISRTKTRLKKSTSSDKDTTTKPAKKTDTQENNFNPLFEDESSDEIEF